MPDRCYLRITLTLAIGSVVAAPASAQSRQQSAIQQATFAREANVPAQEILFGRAVPAIGDEVDQTVSIELRMTTALRQGNTIAEKFTSTVRNAQERTLTTTEITAGRATAVQVRYGAATKQAQRADDGPAPSQAPPRDDPAPQPVAGKTYLCRREPGDEGRLIVTDAAGNIPPLAEYEIVASTMDTVGRPNPFADFLAGRRMRVGETIALPNAVADRLFGMGDDFGKVQQFNLTLQRVETKERVRCAMFHASVEAASSDSSQMRLQVEGPLVVEIDSCRALSTNLSGPVAMSESRGSYSTAYQLLGTGKLSMSIASIFRDAQR